MLLGLLEQTDAACGGGCCRTLRVERRQLALVTLDLCEPLPGLRYRTKRFLINLGRFVSG